MSQPLSYRAAGVDIDAQNEALARSKAAIRRSFTPGVLGDVGLFGGLFDLDKVGAGRDHVLVSSADGVGTKLNVARMMGVYDTVGRDLVQHCIGDILVQGARPLFFMDYVGTGELDPEIISAVISGCADACADNNLALLGGETAEMPGVYQGNDFDLVGFIVGVVHRSKILDGSRIRPGQKLLGLGSSGLHTNGYSLARKIAFERLGHDVQDRPDALGGESIGEALLAPHRSYLSLLWPLLEENKIAGMAHITGGGLVENPPRALPGCHARIDRNAWEVPPLFRWLCEGGDIEMDERYRVFNMGIGMVLAVDESDVSGVRAALEAAGEPVFEIGDVADGEGETEWLS